MLKFLASKGHKIGVCGSCIDARGIKPAVFVEEALKSSLNELIQWTQDSDKIIVL
jgi:uncharacterized protein involved in oxidation of intracellular sulfur